MSAVNQYQILDTDPEQHFDDIAALAAELCGTPTALVSLLDTDRQWFKARVGFDPQETGLDRSVCRHVVADARTIVIPDLTKDERTRNNPLVTGEPGIRFYAGAPLATRFGVVGALCVIDTQPRPSGLLPHQVASLERLARQTVALLEARRESADLIETAVARDTAEATRKLTERRWRDLYRNMDQGFIYARALRDDSGRITDWRYEEVNDAWGKLVGIDPDMARGRTIRELIPAVEDEWVMEFASVVETGEPVHFTRQVGALSRWYDGMAQAVGGDDFTVMFNEVTGRIEEERRRDALLALGDVLRDAGSIAEMTAKASRIIGEAVGATRATFGEMDHTRERVLVAAGWAIDGLPPIEGDHRFDDYGRVREYLIKGDLFVVSDVREDDRLAEHAARWEALHALAVVNVPVRDNGRTTGVLIVHKDQPHLWTHGEITFLRNAADRLEIAAARRRDVERQDIVNGEIAHRLKNSLAMVQAVASQTLRDDASPEGLEAFTRRLQALGAAHDALTAGRWKAATMSDVLAGVLDNAGVRDRCTVSGPMVEMGARAALSTSLLIHELATNAIKYGALSNPDGSVIISWEVRGDADDCEVALDWRESGGPPVHSPTRKGFGSRILRMGMVGTGGSNVRYEEAGLSASFTARLQEVRQA
ncbi:GAF domain-containing protein [Sphingomonas dokdonensis]|uniref:histidine kinase n=1 Tax=Sphingomonas dokdonensis TaxID=344880 RepID=A0A245ZCS7_9SPHN|nr:GAF domain-containing protein [Sphingomonas dokdonensis]OWK27510.1 blue-light-activated histidine kinase [Sphingomonas dokdonensis]